jgi:hypothetical protein
MSIIICRSGGAPRSLAFVFRGRARCRSGTDRSPAIMHAFGMGSANRD